MPIGRCQIRPSNPPGKNLVTRIAHQLEDGVVGFRDAPGEIGDENADDPAVGEAGEPA
jgi:hypothetical protein